MTNIFLVFHLAAAVNGIMATSPDTVFINKADVSAVYTDTFFLELSMSKGIDRRANCTFIGLKNGHGFCVVESKEEVMKKLEKK